MDVRPVMMNHHYTNDENMARKSGNLCEEERIIDTLLSHLSREAESDSAINQPLKEAFLNLRRVAELSNSD